MVAVQVKGTKLFYVRKAPDLSPRPSLDFVGRCASGFDLKFKVQ
jgi:hypothetical protein